MELKQPSETTVVDPSVVPTEAGPFEGVQGRSSVSVIAVYPKFKKFTHEKGTPPPGFNPLFFGHYAQMDKDDYLHEMADIVRNDGAIYRTITNDLYDQGLYLMKAKYKFLRISYACFFVGFLVAPLVLLVTQVTD